jgi:hypothetical protein
MVTWAESRASSPSALYFILALLIEPCDLLVPKRRWIFWFFYLADTLKIPVMLPTGRRAQGHERAGPHGRRPFPQRGMRILTRGLRNYTAESQSAQRTNERRRLLTWILDHNLYLNYDIDLGDLKKRKLSCQLNILPESARWVAVGGPRIICVSTA